MKHCCKTVVFATTVIMVLSTQCMNPAQHTGNGSDVGNGMITGLIYGPDGKTAAVGAKVYLRRKQSLADTMGVLAKKSAAADTATAITDENGTFVIDAVDTGVYVIESSDLNNNLAFKDSVFISGPDTTITVPPDTLKPAGALKGAIRLSEGGDPRKVFVLAFGIDRFARVNEDGSFRFTMLAEGKYDLRIIASLDDYGVLDTLNIPVNSADTTNLDTIELPFTGIPTPKEISVSYDTMNQIVTLSWSKVDVAIVNGYYVYRRNVDSNTVLSRINTSPLIDTVYRDSTGIQDLTYEYRVSAIDKNATEGVKSAGVSVKVIPLYSFINGWGSPQSAGNHFNSPSSITMDSSGNLFIADRGLDHIVKYDTAGQLLLTIGSNGSDSGKFQAPWDIEVDHNKQIFVADYGNGRIQRFDATNHVNLIIPCDSAFIGFSAKPRHLQIDSSGNIYAIVIRGDAEADFAYQALVVYDALGVFISSTNIAPLIQNKLSQDFLIHKGIIYISATSDLYTFTMTLSALNHIHDVRYPMTIAKNSLLYCGGSNIIGFYKDGPIKVMDLSGNFIARFGKQPDYSAAQTTWTTTTDASLSGLVVDAQYNVYTLESSGTFYAIKKFKRN
ncbi:MAG: hypothetical protein JW915_03550 [Chitinispirillaceae bacterium]|nr:hypothetical protein [Chitinispirillaceae bacterium]